MSHLVTHPDRDCDALREAFFGHARAMLQSPPQRDEAWLAACTCLDQWGLDPDSVAALPIGYLSDVRLARGRLVDEGFSQELIAASRLLGDPRLDGRLIGPIRAPSGRIESFWARHPAARDSRCLYLSGAWKKDIAVFGLDVTWPAVAAASARLVLVEDIMDSLLLRRHGLLQAVAAGGSLAEMTESRWQRLAQLGVTAVTLAPDSLRSPTRAVLAAIDSAARAPQSPQVDVLTSEAIGGARGPWELARTVGAEALAAILQAQPVHGLTYKALQIAAVHKQGMPWTAAARQAAVTEALQFYASVNQRNVPQLDALFMPTLFRELGLVWNGRPPHIEVEAQRAIPEEEPKPPEMAPQPAAAAKPRPADYCEIHRCRRNECLCWD